jgi:hypothetical protein
MTVTDPVMTSDERLARMMEKILVHHETKVAWTLNDGYVLTTYGAAVILDEDDMILVKDLHTRLRAQQARMVEEYLR